MNRAVVVPGRRRCVLAAALVLATLPIAFPSVHGSDSDSGPRPLATPDVLVPADPPPAAMIAVAASGTQGEPTLSVRPDRLSNGGVGLVSITGLVAGDEVTGAFAGVALPFSAGPGRATALVGIDLDLAPGEHRLEVAVRRAGGPPLVLARAVPVEDAGYAVERLTLPADKVSDFDEKTLGRIEREKAELKALFATWSGTRRWKGFRRPVPGEIRSRFGGRRVINGEPRNPHTGIDQRGGQGTPIAAVADGVVAYVGDQFFSGKVTVLDHGQGTYSLYAHQSKVRVRVGQEVAAGTPIGEIGMTGRVTGPHLHWGVRVNGARVDPEKLLALDLTEPP